MREFELTDKIFDYIMSSVWSQLNFMIMAVVAAIIGLVWLLPVLKGLIVHEKKAWLGQLVENSTDESSKMVFEETLTKYSDNNNRQPFYLLFKLQLVVSGLALVFGGILLMLFDVAMEKEVMVLVPLIFGGIVFAVYKFLFSDSVIWKEVGLGGLYAGFAYTFTQFFDVYKLDFMREDISFFIVLFTGLFLYKKFKSNVVTLVFFVLIYGSRVMTYVSGDAIEWLNFIGLLPWLFLAAMVYLWIPRLEKVKEVGMLEIAFGILLFSSSMELLSAFSSTLLPLTMGILLPVLYIISKLYYSNSAWLISKPIQLMVAANVIYLVIAYSNGGAMESLNSSYYIFTKWSFYKVFMYAIIGGLGYVAYLLYDKIDESKSNIDNLILLFPPFFIVVAWFGDWGGSYLVLAYAMMLGFSYLSKGFANKDELFVVLGSIILIGSVYNKLSQFISGKWFTSQYSIGLFLIVLGLGLIAFMVYLKSQWNVSNENNEALPITKTADVELS